ncbi:MAG: ABC transporter permease [Bacillota bacterium]
MRGNRLRYLGSSVIGPLSAMALAAVAVAISTDRFLQAGNLMNIALQVSIVALMAIGSTFVVLTGGIDLSPGSAIALITMILAMTIKFLGVPIPLAILAAILLGAGLGLINGVLSTYVRIPTFITTLATMSVFRGIAFLFNNGSPVFSVSNTLEPVFYGTLLGVPLPFFYVLAFYTLAALFLRYTALGRGIYAVGGNEAAARLSGIDVHYVRLMAFVMAGVMAAVAAVLMTARLNSGSPNYGVGMELQAIAAAVIGGASLNGGHGNVIATLIGALTIVIVQNGLNLNAVPTSWQNIATGTIIALAVLIDMWRVELGALFMRVLRRPVERGRSAPPADDQ